MKQRMLDKSATVVYQYSDEDLLKNSNLNNNLLHKVFKKSKKSKQDTTTDTSLHERHNAEREVLVSVSPLEDTRSPELHVLNMQSHNSDLIYSGTHEEGGEEHGGKLTGDTSSDFTYEKVDDTQDSRSPQKTEPKVKQVLLSETQSDENDVTPGGESEDTEGEGDQSSRAKKIKKLYSVFTKSYDLKKRLDYYNTVDTHIMPKDMKFIIDYRHKPIRDRVGKIMKNVYQWATNPLIDKMVQEFCEQFGMTHSRGNFNSEDRVFGWYSRANMKKVLSAIKPNNVNLIGNWVYWDHILTDHQCLVSRLGRHVLEPEQTYPAHYCYLDSTNKSDSNLSYVEKQLICPHQFKDNNFLPCTVDKCPNKDKTFCPCFEKSIFIQPYFVLATKVLTNKVLESFRNGEFEHTRWYVKASNLKGGNGIQFIDNADELETFFRYDLFKKMRGQCFALQRAVPSPKLHEGKKFDLQMFLLIVVLTEHRVLGFLHPGYVRIAQEAYDPESNDLRCHFTDPFLFDPDYTRYKTNRPAPTEDYCVPYNEFATAAGLPAFTFKDFKTTEKPLNPDLEKLMNIAARITESMDSIVFSKPGTFQLFNLSISYDDTLRPFLTNVERFPSFKGPDTASDTQNLVVPGVLTEALTLTFELLQRDFKTRQEKLWMDIPDVAYNHQKLIPAQENFAWVYSTPPEKMVCLGAKKPRAAPHWYWNWRNTEDLNEYILYLKNHRIKNQKRAPDFTEVGRKLFGHSAVYMIKKELQRQEDEQRKEDEEAAQAGKTNSSNVELSSECERII